MSDSFRRVLASGARTEFCRLRPKTFRPAIIINSRTNGSLCRVFEKSKDKGWIARERGGTKGRRYTMCQANVGPCEKSSFFSGYRDSPRGATSFTGEQDPALPKSCASTVLVGSCYPPSFVVTVVLQLPNSPVYLCVRVSGVAAIPR